MGDLVTVELIGAEVRIIDTTHHNLKIGEIGRIMKTPTVDDPWFEIRVGPLSQWLDDYQFEVL